MSSKKKMSDSEQQFQTENDARTMQDHAEITADPDRMQRATDHLGKKAGMMQDAHKAARKHLEKKTKGRLKKTFGSGGQDKGGTFASEAEKEQGPMEAIVHEE